jgi:hypothetical protein
MNIIDLKMVLTVFAGVLLGEIIWKCGAAYLSGLFGKKPAPPVREVNIRSCDQSPGLNARKTWALLYPDFLASFMGAPLQIHDWDSFLCDLKGFAHYYEKGVNTLFWELGRGNGYTELKDSYFPNYTHKIVLKPGDSIVVTRMIVEQDRSPEDT